MLQLFRLCSTLCLFLFCGALCHGSDLVFIRAESSLAAEQSQLETASQFYGLDLKVTTVRPGDQVPPALLRRKTTLAAAIDSHALELIPLQPLLRSLERSTGDQIPLLVLGLTPDSAAAVLNRMSGGGIQGVRRLSEGSGLDYIVNQAPDVTKELSGISLPYRGQPPYVLALGSDALVRRIVAVRTTRGDLPVFVEARSGRHSIFFACAWTFERREHQAMPGPDIVDAFTAVAPAMMFVRYAAGAHGWHAPGHYANLTVDDPWLREPYGRLDYVRLLAEMKSHNFHTTIAFIPWNYDRNSPDMASLFRENPDRYSIAVHGDNHDHKEFEDFRDSPFDAQAPKLKQALARMDAFQNLTGIPYDRVFVFPHSIGECPILRELERDNYMATVNSTSVPMGCKRPPGPLFDLRPITVAFYGFPSILRYPAAVQVPLSVVAVNEYLDNPLFFYVHQEFFSRGIHAFDEIADEVNKREPDTEWRSLGYIAAHLFLIRQRHDARYDVFSFSSTIDLDNFSNGSVTYDITKQEPSPDLIHSVTVNGRLISTMAQDGVLTFSVDVPPRGSAHIAVVYNNFTTLADASIAHRSIRVYLLRRASDFRDIWLSRLRLGNAITAYYYEHNETPLRMLTIATLITLIAAGALCCLIAVIRHRKLISSSPVAKL